jgi:GMP synthase-like glutamine amidotransferase
MYFFKLINKHFGGTVGIHQRREDGRIKIEVTYKKSNSLYVKFLKVNPQSELFQGLAQEQWVLLTHGDGVTKDTVAHEGFSVTATSGEFVAGNSLFTLLLLIFNNFLNSHLLLFQE